MTDESIPLQPVLINQRPSNRFNVTLERLMDAPVRERKTPIMGTDNAWALKLKTCVDTVAKELHIDVLGAKPIKCFGANDSRDMLFEVDTSRGSLEVIRTRAGEHMYNWKMDHIYHA